jgi:hypothetical protein
MKNPTKHLWTAADIPDQRGRTAVVSGTGDLGYETGLARAGAEVTLAGRSEAKGLDAVWPTSRSPRICNTAVTWTPAAS